VFVRCIIACCPRTQVKKFTLPKLLVDDKERYTAVKILLDCCEAACLVSVENPLFLKTQMPVIAAAAAFLEKNGFEINPGTYRLATRKLCEESMEKRDCGVWFQRWYPRRGAEGAWTWADMRYCLVNAKYGLGSEAEFGTVFMKGWYNETFSKLIIDFDEEKTKVAAKAFLADMVQMHLETDADAQLNYEPPSGDDVQFIATAFDTHRKMSRGFAAMLYPKYGTLGSSEADVFFLMPMNKEEREKYGAASVTGPMAGIFESVTRSLLNSSAFEAMRLDFFSKLGSSVTRTPVMDVLEEEIVGMHEQVSSLPIGSWTVDPSDSPLYDKLHTLIQKAIIALPDFKPPHLRNGADDEVQESLGNLLDLVRKHARGLDAATSGPCKAALLTLVKEAAEFVDGDLAADLRTSARAELAVLSETGQLGQLQIYAAGKFHSDREVTGYLEVYKKTKNIELTPAFYAIMRSSRDNLLMHITQIVYGDATSMRDTDADNALELLELMSQDVRLTMISGVDRSAIDKVDYKHLGNLARTCISTQCCMHTISTATGTSQETKDDLYMSMVKLTANAEKTSNGPWPILDTISILADDQSKLVKTYLDDFLAGQVVPFLRRASGPYLAELRTRVVDRRDAVQLRAGGMTDGSLWHGKFSNWSDADQVIAHYGQTVANMDGPRLDADVELMMQAPDRFHTFSVCISPIPYCTCNILALSPAWVQHL
jgi:hypothetical protein